MSQPLTGGFLNLDKPAGLTSRDVVNRVQRLVRPAKVGHAGTLDPLATGVLVVAVGAATRLIEFVQELPKEYRATFLLGRTSPTEDIEGEVVELPHAGVPALADLIAATTRLTGTNLQRPPVFSALKVAGRRAYQLARRGETPQLAPRPITIDRFDVLRYEYPELETSIRCSSGTYVRSLGRDLAESLGTGAVMSALVRTAIGRFRLAGCCSLELLNAERILDALLPMSRAVEHLPRQDLTDGEVIDVRHGKRIARQGFTGDAVYAAFDPRGTLVGTLTCKEPGFLWPERILPSE